MAESGPKACGSITDDIGGELQSRTGFQSLASGFQGVLALFRDHSRNSDVLPVDKEDEDEERSQKHKEVEEHFHCDEPDEDHDEEDEDEDDDNDDEEEAMNDQEDEEQKTRKNAPIYNSHALLNQNKTNLLNQLINSNALIRI